MEKNNRLRLLPSGTASSRDLDWTNCRLLVVITVMFFLNIPLAVYAQSHSISISCPENVKEDSIISYKVVVHGVDKYFEISPLTELSVKGGQIISGPHINTTLIDRVRNGIYSVEKTIDLNYQIRPIDHVVKIGPIKCAVMMNHVIIDTLTSQSMIIPVLHDSRLNGNAVDNKKSGTKISEQERKGECFIIWTASKDTISLGETIHCYCDLYTTINIESVGNQFVNINDCYFNEVSGKNKSFEKVTYNGNEYYNVRLFDCVISPLRTGQFAIGGDTFDCILSENGTDPFEDFWNGVQRTRKESVKSNTIRFFVSGVEDKSQFMDEKSKRNGDIFLLCDISSSMNANDIYPSRRSAMTSFANQWISRNANSGLIAFAGSIDRFLESKDVSGHHCSSSFIPDTAKVDGTSSADAMLAALSKGFKVKDLILISDGINNDGHFTMTTAFKLLNCFGTRVHYIYLNSLKDSVGYHLPKTTDDDSYSDESVTLENEMLTPQAIKQITNLTRQTGGDFYVVKTSEDLKSLIPKIEERISKAALTVKTIMPYDRAQVEKALHLLSKSIE